MMFFLRLPGYISFFCLMAVHSFAQTLPIVEATAGDGQEVNWPQIQKEEDGEKDGPGFFYRDCSQGVQAGAASSTLAAQGGKNYGVGNLTDDNPMTAWVEGKPGYGIGEFFTVISPRVNSIFNGYQATPAVWKNNSRVKKFKVYADGKPICYLTLKDEMGEQLFELPYSLDDGGNVTFKFEIAEVYKGLKWDDVAISHVDNNGCCFSATTTIERFGQSSVPVNDLLQPSDILCININTGDTYPASVFHIATQVHFSLFEIRTAHHIIAITPDHPLLVKNYGFASMERLKRIFHVAEIEKLDKLIAVMVWSAGEMQYEEVIGIRKLTGKYRTYSVKGLPAQSAYVADGFVTMSY